MTALYDADKIVRRAIEAERKRVGDTTPPTEVMSLDRIKGYIEGYLNALNDCGQL